MVFETNPIQQLTGLMARLRCVKCGKSGWVFERIASFSFECWQVEM